MCAAHQILGGTVNGQVLLSADRSYIVNMRHVQKFDNHLISLTGDRAAYLTRRKYKEFKDAYLFYLESTK